MTTRNSILLFHAIGFLGMAMLSAAAWMQEQLVVTVIFAVIGTVLLARGIRKAGTTRE